MTTVYDFKERTQGGQELDLQQFAGDVMVIVNTASKCGLAPQLTELQALYDQYQDEGFTSIGCPFGWARWPTHRTLCADDSAKQDG